MVRVAPQWRAVSVAAAVLGLADGGHAASRPAARLYLGQPTWPAYAGSASVLRDYVNAMKSLRASLGVHAGLAKGENGAAAAPGGWTFVSKSGSQITRLPDGRLRINRSDFERNWFSETICGVSTWPALKCEDGRQLRIEVIGASRLSLDGEEFHLVEKEGP